MKVKIKKSLLKQRIGQVLMQQSQSYVVVRADSQGNIGKDSQAYGVYNKRQLPSVVQAVAVKIRNDIASQFVDPNDPQIPDTQFVKSDLIEVMPLKVFKYNRSTQGLRTLYKMKKLKV